MKPFHSTPGQDSAPAEAGQPPASRSAIARIARRIFGLSTLTVLGQAIFILALPLLTKFYSPEAIGILMIYMATLNFAGAVIGLRYETNIIVQRTRDDANATLALSVKLMVAIAVSLTFLLYVVTKRGDNEASIAIQRCIWIFPLGLFCFGLVEAMSYWAIRFGHFRVFGIARLIQGALMTSLQLTAGWIGAPPIWLVLAHLGSQIAFIGYCASQMITRQDIAQMRQFTNEQLARLARRDAKTALFIMPAVLITLGISNLPTLIVGSIFGAAASAHFGIAYRVIGAPVQLIAWPLTHVTSNELINSKSPDQIVKTLIYVLALAFAILAVPLGLVALFVTDVTTYALGEQWRRTGEFASILAVAGVFQVVATPLCEIPLLFRRPEFRLLVDSVRGILVVAIFGFAILMHWNEVSAVKALAVAMAMGFLFSMAMSLYVIRVSLKAGVTPENRSPSLDTA